MVPTGIRLYRDEDFSQVVEIAISTLGASRSEAEGYLCWASNERERNGTAQIFIAESDGMVVGFMILQWGATTWNNTAEIGWIAVLPQHQRKSLGSGLIKEMEQYARKKGLRKVYVEPSVEADTALHFYIKNGYKPEAMRKDWYREGEDSVILGKHLPKA